MSVKSEARSGRPSTNRNDEVIEKVRQVVMEDGRLILRKIVEQSIKSTTWRFYVAFMMLCEESGHMWAGKTWQLHPDNAAAHPAHATEGFLARHNRALVRQPPYSPDLAPSHFWLFPKLKTTLNWTRFQSRKNIMEKTKAELRSIKEVEFKRCFQKWQRRWKKYVHLQGE